MRMKTIYACFLVMLLTSCAATVPLNFQTASGRPEVSFNDLSFVEVKSRLIDGCIRRGLIINEQGSSSVICEKTMEVGQGAIMAQLVLGNQYSTTPVQKAQFTITRRGQDVVVVATRQWVETQMAFGQMQRAELNTNEQLNNLQLFLDSI